MFYTVRKIRVCPCKSFLLLIFATVLVCFIGSSNQDKYANTSIGQGSFSLSDHESQAQLKPKFLVITFNKNVSQFGSKGPSKIKPKNKKKGNRRSRQKRSIPRFLMLKREKSGLGDLLLNLLSPESASRHLQNLKDKLLCYYAKKSGEIGSARDGIGFPSLEGALLSLAFLTFAVFLIDLVQTLLSRVRGPAIVNGTLVGRKRRNVDKHHKDKVVPTLTSKVLTAIEKPFFYARNRTKLENSD